MCSVQFVFPRTCLIQQTLPLELERSFKPRDAAHLFLLYRLRQLGTLKGNIEGVVGGETSILIVLGFIMIFLIRITSQCKIAAAMNLIARGQSDLNKYHFLSLYFTYPLLLIGMASRLKWSPCHNSCLEFNQQDRS